VALDVGQVISGKYRIVRLVGEGGMGAVYEAEHTLLGKRVAIKVIAPEFAHDAQAVQRFYREAQAAARIGHENIVEVNDVAQTEDGQPYIVMELLHGKSLAAAILESAPLPVGRAVDITSQVLEALQAAHDAGIVHRDMKPDNVFLTRVAGRDDFVKLLDFGISKVRSAQGTKLTQTGSVLGTPQYMSPEQAQGETNVDGRADVWAVGVMVYEMLIGRVPFEGENYNRVMFAVVGGPIVRPRALRHGISAEMDAVVMRAMDRDLGRRYATAAAFREALVGAWMAESGFSLPGARTPTPGAINGDEATEIGPAPAPPAPHAAVAAVPAASTSPALASAVVVVEPATSSPSAVPTSPRMGQAGRFGTVKATPNGTVAVAPRTGTRARRDARLLAVAGLVLAAAVAATVVALASRSGESATPARQVTARPDAVAGEPPAAEPVARRPSEATRVPSATPPSAVPDASSSAAPLTAALPPAAEMAVGPRQDAGAATPPPEVRPDAVSVGPRPSRDATTRPQDVVPPGVVTGRLTVVTIPPTEVYLDGGRVRDAPFSGLEVAVGPHRLRLVDPSTGREHAENVAIEADRETTVRRTAEQMGWSPAPTGRSDGGIEASPAADAGVMPTGIRIRTRDGGRTP
jgi:serine/threonine-protein kinase